MSAYFGSSKNLKDLKGRRLATPTTSGLVERVLTGCALITTRNRNKLSAGSISLTMFLKEAWGQVQELGLQGEVDGMFSYEEEVVSE